MRLVTMYHSIGHLFRSNLLPSPNLDWWHVQCTSFLRASDRQVNDEHDHSSLVPLNSQWRILSNSSSEIFVEFFVCTSF